MSQLFEPQLCHQKITLNALHLIPLTLHSIHTATEFYIVSLKANQANLYRQCVCRSLFNKADYGQFDEEKERHSRVDRRTYRCYSLQPLVLASRWRTTGLPNLICVERQGHQVDTEQKVVSYFVSNAQPSSQSEATDLFSAIRQHWCVEVMHHKRDATLSEDSLRTGKSGVSKKALYLRVVRFASLGIIFS